MQLTTASRDVIEGVSTAEDALDIIRSHDAYGRQ